MKYWRIVIYFDCVIAGLQISNRSVLLRLMISAPYFFMGELGEAVPGSAASFAASPTTY